LLQGLKAHRLFDGRVQSQWRFPPGIRPCPEAGTRNVPTAFNPRTTKALHVRLLLFLSSVSLLVGNACATSPTPFLTLTGEVAGDLFGASVAGVGDMDGDGHEELLVGALRARPGHTGRAYVYFGGPLGDSIPDAVLQDDRVDSSGHPYQFGSVVAGVGDVNGDGRADIAVGEPYVDCSNGAASIFWGGSTVHRHADLRLSPRTGGCGAMFGYSISSAGDLNDDGYGDLLIGAPGAHGGDLWMGQAYVIYGAANPDSTPDAVIGSPPPSFGNFRGFGYSGVPVGDVNGDGKTDIVIAQGTGLPRFTPPRNSGAAFLYLGGEPLGAAPDATLESRLYDQAPYFGYHQAVAPAGDMNGDGYDDFLVRASPWKCSTDSYPTQCTMEDGAFVYFGGPRVDEIPNHRLFLRGDYGVGVAIIAGGRDSNGDGYPDVVIGNTRGAFVYFGGPALDSIPDVTLEPVIVGSNFANSVSLADMNGDGVADVIVGAPGSGQSGNTDPGHVYVYDLSAPLRADAFVRDGHRTIPLTDGPPRIWVQYEPVNGDYQNADVDLSSLRLTSDGTGGATEIPAAATRRNVESDTDQDGIPELRAGFERSDLARLFSSVRGRHMVEVALEGRLERGRKFRAPLALTILGTGKPDKAIASVAPNPLNPRGVLTFSIGEPGNVTVRLYDLGGRSVRTVIAAEQFPAGVHQISIDGRDERGVALASGVYFYRVETSGGASTGRFVVLK